MLHCRERRYIWRHLMATWKTSKSSSNRFVLNRRLLSSFSLITPMNSHPLSAKCRNEFLCCRTQTSGFLTRTERLHCTGRRAARILKPSNVSDSFWSVVNFYPLCIVSKHGRTFNARTDLSLADPGRGPWGPGPPCPQDFFKIMQFSGNFKGKPPILGSGPP